MGKILAWKSSFLLCYEMLGFMLGDSRNAGMSCHRIMLLSTMVCWFSCGHKQVFRKINGDRCFSKFAWAPHFQWNMSLENHENRSKRTNSCVTWRKMGINCAWRCWLKWYETADMKSGCYSLWEGLNSKVANVRLDQYFETVIYSRRLLCNHRVTPDLLCLL